MLHLWEVWNRHRRAKGRCHRGKERDFQIPKAVKVCQRLNDGNLNVVEGMEKLSMLNQRVPEGQEYEIQSKIRAQPSFPCLACMKLIINWGKL